jgi:hypothetical protein
VTKGRAAKVTVGLAVRYARMDYTVTKISQGGGPFPPYFTLRGWGRARGNPEVTVTYKLVEPKPGPQGLRELLRF